ncbi:MAG: cadherin-like beta sandwich domain-containing protein [Eubacteriales bacterium]|nr:cadherin-like beta sandwich domain-containing protein [Eubacteriales bacterium]
MKKSIVSILIVLLLLSQAALSLAQPMNTLPPDRLVSLTHNAPNTGIMLPDRFDPWQNTYLLTVAHWVSRITFEPVTSSPASVVTVNGQPVASGQKSQIINMTDKPQEVQIVVSAYEGGALTAQNTYIVYLQRRPSEYRTRVSAGYITQIDMKGGIATISADLVTITYQGETNRSTFYNDTVYLYKYDTSPNCLFYYGTKQNPVRAFDAQEFYNNYLLNGSNLYYLVYIENEIVAVLPYASD